MVCSRWPDSSCRIYFCLHCASSDINRFDTKLSSLLWHEAVNAYKIANCDCKQKIEYSSLGFSFNRWILNSIPMRARGRGIRPLKQWRTDGTHSFKKYIQPGWKGAQRTEMQSIIQGEDSRARFVLGTWQKRTSTHVSQFWGKKDGCRAKVRRRNPRPHTYVVFWGLWNNEIREGCG